MRHEFDDRLNRRLIAHDTPFRNAIGILVNPRQTLRCESIRSGFSVMRVGYWAGALRHAAGEPNHDLSGFMMIGRHAFRIGRSLPEIDLNE